MRWLVQWLVTACILLAMSSLLNGIEVASLGAALLASFLLSILNLVVKPILVILTLPVTILTLGLFLLVINGATLYLTAAIMGDAFVLSNFVMALFAALLISIANLFIQDSLQAVKK
ncbi:phage holin family protein [Aureibacillus halotolerans]|uniref:Putative membrane protein n=1 Tax=Aureibacillus halotolerans TaxID=1508390 RepID=A0A4R6TY58_9BACI|nr:phage holin family protein [Aureibacillus halotolerans]TDQ36959.1 putative membrane protein [Aureibacillus halotolerans]